MIYRILGLVVATACVVSSAADEPYTWHASVEGGPVWQSRNDFRIPSATATKVSLAENTSGPFRALRFHLGYRWGEQFRHEVRGLIAPLSLTSSITFSTPVDFQNQTFAAGTATEATYQFNSYRATYRYAFYHGETWNWSAGVTAKIRDAKVQLVQGAVAAEKKDVGVVPLLHVHGEWRFAESWKMLLDMDALAAPQGRAEDILLAVEWNPISRWFFYTGYRMLEGGADNRDVFTSAWLHYAAFGARYTW